jgi:glycosyltransferase involved in cell wall biosynthesis
MKILLFNSVFYPTKLGGAEQSVFNLAEGLISLGYEVGVVSIVKESERVGSKRLDNGVMAYYLPDKNVYWPFVTLETPNKIVRIAKKLGQRLLDLINYRYRNEIKAVIDDFSPDIVHTNNLKGISVLVWHIAKKHDCKVVHTLRDYYVQCHRESRRKNEKNCDSICIECRCYSTPKRVLSSKVDGIVGISNFILDSHISDGYFQKSKQTIIYNSVSPHDDFDTFAMNPISDKARVFGYIGRMEYDKGVMQLVDRVKQLPETSTLRFVFAGTGEKRIETELENDPLIDYRGFMKPADFFAEIDVLIVPSLWFEPMGRVVIEAYAYGIPVMVHGAGGLLELVYEGKTGVVIDINSQSDFESALLRFDQLDYKNLSSNCLEQAKCFSNREMLSKYSELYQSV